MEVTKPIKQNLIQIVKNDNQLKEVILINIVKMFINRNIIKPDHLDMYSSLSNSRIDQNDETFFELDSDEADKLGVKLINIKFINRKITTIKKVIDIEDFMNKTGYKIVIVNNIAPKASKQILEYKNTELFYDDELQINLIDHILVPKHYKLNELEIEQLKNAYQFKPKNAKRMYPDDPVAKYYNLKVDDIVKVERPSTNSGISIDYRVVVVGSIYK
jgi:DNA-directed RNA polymerase I, II, and III subunit RPABC1